MLYRQASQASLFILSALYLSFPIYEFDCRHCLIAVFSNGGLLYRRPPHKGKNIVFGFVLYVLVACLFTCLVVRMSVDISKPRSLQKPNIWGEKSVK